MVRSELEFERTWRLDELRLLENGLAGMTTDDDKRRYRKTLVVMLYSHFEGFCRIALLVYVKAINRAEFVCHDVNDALAASSLTPLFNAVISGSKHRLFKLHLPDDTALHFLSRRIDFLSKLPEVLGEPVEIDDELVNTGANLKTVILKKNFYQLGLNSDRLDHHRVEVDRLVDDRNAIAHGVRRSGLDEAEYAKLRTSALDVMDTVIGTLIDAIDSGQYRASRAPIQRTTAAASRRRGMRTRIWRSVANPVRR